MNNKNIFKFSIYIYSRIEYSDIQNEIIECFKNASTQNSTYEEYVSREWNNIKEKKVKMLYSTNCIKALVKKGHTKYCVLKRESNDSKDSITCEILVISSATNINDAINVVYKSLKEILKKFKIKILNKEVLLYLYDGEKKDIYSTEFMIKADVNSFTTLNKWEKLRLVLCFVTAIISFIVIKRNISDNTNSICLSVIASSIFFCITEGLIKLSFKKQLEVTDLTNCFETEAPFVTNNQEEDINKLSNPKIDEEEE